MKLNFLASAAVVAIAAMAPSIANATVTISNTGVASAWSVSSDANPTYGTPATSGTAATVSNATVNSIGWLANSAATSWISTNSTGYANPGYYNYSTVINNNATSPASLTIKFAVDDYLTSVLLDGAAVTGVQTGIGSYNAFTTLTITGITSGNHNLAFYTANNYPGQTNGSNPAGFRLEAAVPEPATWGLMLIGFGAIGGALRTSRRKVVFA